MRMIGRVAAWLAAIAVVLVALLLLSVFIDGALGAGRVAALVNTSIPNGAARPVGAFVARPEGPGPHPAVIMVHEWWGLKPEIVGKAEALAREGYVVVAPDVFRGSTTSWIPRAIWQVSTTPAAQVDADLDAVYAWLAAQPDVRADRIGIMGFCFGGGTSLRYSVGNGDLAATAVFYGSPIVDPAQLSNLGGPVLGIFGGADQMIPVSEVQAFERGLEQAGVPHQVSIYEGQPHAFVRSMEEISRGGPQQEAWDELLGFFDASLKGGSSGARPAPGGATAVDDPALFLNADRALHLFVCDRAVRRAA